MQRFAPNALRPNFEYKLELADDALLKLWVKLKGDHPLRKVLVGGPTYILIFVLCLTPIMILRPVLLVLHQLYWSAYRTIFRRSKTRKDPFSFNEELRSSGKYLNETRGGHTNARDSKFM
jgi:hypothetical protein